MSNAEIRKADKRYSIVSNDYELTLNRYSNVRISKTPAKDILPFHVEWCISKHGPSLVGILSPQIIPSDAPKPGQIVEISGESDTGKTMLTMDLIAKAIIPNEYGGKGVTVIVIDTNSNYNAHRMIKCIENQIYRYISTKNISVVISDEEMKDIASKALEKIKLYFCYSLEEYEMSLLHCKGLITIDKKVSLLVVDSISSYYYFETSDEIPISFDTYAQRKAYELKNLANEFKLVVIYTRLTQFSTFSPLKDDRIDYKIHLTCTKKRQSEQVTRQANNYYSDQKMSNEFDINDEFAIQWK